MSRTVQNFEWWTQTNREVYTNTEHDDRACISLYSLFNKRKRAKDVMKRNNFKIFYFYVLSPYIFHANNLSLLLSPFLTVIFGQKKIKLFEDELHAQ